jgi:hypothetical protein
MKFAHHMTTMLRATAVAASAAALVAPAAAAMTRGTTDGTTGDMSDAVSRYITNHGAPVSDAVDRWLATHSVSPANGVQGYRLITDTLGGNGGAAASAPAAGGTGLDWGALGMGVGLGVLLSAFLVGARRIGRARRLAHS